jgi:hypothetical protein
MEIWRGQLVILFFSSCRAGPASDVCCLDEKASLLKTSEERRKPETGQARGRRGKGKESEMRGKRNKTRAK